MASPAKHTHSAVLFARRALQDLEGGAFVS
jgi:hypothetical protein